MDLDYDHNENGIFWICNHCNTFLNNLPQFHGSNFQNHWTAASIHQGLFGQEAIRNKAKLPKNKATQCQKDIYYIKYRRYH